MPRTILLLTLVLLGACSGDRQTVAITGTSANTTVSAKAAPLTPEQVASGLDDLTFRIRERINLASDRIDMGADNTIRRRTLRFRMRASEVAWRAVQNPNHLAGLIELWLWMTAVDEFTKTAQQKDLLGERIGVLRELGSNMHADVETFARQALPAKGFDNLKERIDKAAANGELLSASPQREKAIVGDLLEMTQLQNVLGLALSPFEALRGIGSGADSMAAMTVTANRAVDLMARYPELIAWNLRLAVIDIEEQDTTRETRAALKQLLQMIDNLPTRLRTEATALLESSSPVQQQSQQTLREIATTAEALNKLNSGVQQTLAAIDRLSPPSDPAKPTKEPGRPFDIREYTTAIEASAKTLQQAQVAIETAADKGLPAADAAAARFEAAADRVLWKLGALIVFTALLSAGLLVLFHRLKRQG